MNHTAWQRLGARWTWGLRPVPLQAVHARTIERRWRWPMLLLLLATVPAFYAEMLSATPAPWAGWAYGLAGLAVLAALGHTASHCSTPRAHLRGNGLDLLLGPGLLVAAALPASSLSTLALGFRLVLALLILLRMVWAVRHLITRGGLAYLLAVSAAVLGLCGVGFWWLEPETPTLGDGLWLAFTTAATVGYGDSVPTTPASKIFSVFVVMLGYGVLSLVTAAIATRWVASEERHIEREILRDVHHQLSALKQELAGLRQALQLQQGASPPPDMAGDGSAAASKRQPV